MINNLSNIKTLFLKLWKTENGIFKFLTISIVFSVIVLSIIFYKYHINGASKVGDTIGGILGAIISIFAAWLVYISFQSQVEANRQITKQLNDERLFNIYNIFNKELSDNALYKNINEKYQQYIKTLNYSIEKKIIDETLYELLTNLKKEIDDNKMIFENSKVLFNSFKKISNDKDEYYKIFFKRMKESLNVYSDYIKKFNNFSKIPIIKISNPNIVLEKKATFQINNFHKQKFKIINASIKNKNSENDDLLQTLNLNYETENSNKDICLNIDIKKNIEVMIDWKIEFENKLYIYNNQETYQINNS